MLDLKTLHHVVADAAALRSRSHLQPAGGEGDKVFPPTYSEAAYATEVRLVDGEDTPCVLLDAVQSQANRFEGALQDAFDRGRLKIPVLRVAFPDDLARELGPITSLTSPHRCYDAILRDSTLGGTAFPKSDVGKALAAARTTDAGSLFRWCPTALIFGAWDSTGARGGMGAKFTRAVSSEIVGIGARPGVRTSSRIDPLGVRAQVKVLPAEGDRADWSLAAEDEKKAKRPSEVNHGNVTPTITPSGGVTIVRAEETWVLTLPALRRYRFPVDGTPSDEADSAARTALVALALAARALARDDGHFLRSRCHLVPVPGTSMVEIVAKNGSVAPLDEPDADAAIDLLNEAVDAARTAGLAWEADPVELVAQEKLVELVRRSFDLAPGSASEE